MSNLRTLLTLTCLLAGGTAVAAPPLFHEEVVARQYVAARPELARGGDLVVERRDPGLIRFRRHHRGVPIIGGVVTVRLDDGGAVRGADADPGVVPADLSVEPTLTADDARNVAAAFGPAARGRATLEVLALPEHEPRLAWAVALPWNPRTGAWRVHVDAEDGRVLSRQPAVWHAKRGKVFKTARPVVGALEEVALDLPDGARRLANPRFDVKSCVDKKRCETVGGSSFHTCDFESLATPDGNGDFLFERPTVDTAPDDPLAEVNAFYHMTRAEEAFRALGAPALTAVPMRVFTNLRVSEDEGTCAPDTPLVPYENAFFTSQFDDAGPAFAFGQGEEVDYAYDWPVVFHEYAHGVQFASYGQVFTYRLDQEGLNDEAGALGEGTADYFAAVFTGNVRLGEYALPADLIRDITLQAKCPDNVTGEVHEDGKIFASALWAARVALPEEQRPQLDRALLAVFARTGDVTSFEFYRRTIIEEMTTLAGSAAATIVQQKLAANGLAGCRRIVSVELGQRWPFFFAYSSGIDDLAFPSPLQWRITLPKKADRLMVTTTRDVSTRLAAATRLAVKFGTENIRWSLVDLHPDGNAYPVTRRDARTLTVEGPFPKGAYVVQLAFGNIPTIPGNAGVFMEGVAIDAEYPPDEGGGCAVGGGVGAGCGGAAAALLLALAGVAGRVTSRRTSRPCRGSRSSR